MKARKWMNKATGTVHLVATGWGSTALCGVEVSEATHKPTNTKIKMCQRCKSSWEGVNREIRRDRY